MMKMVYLDNAATTPMDPEVIAVTAESMRRDFANSGTVYNLGLDAQRRIEEAEEQIRNSLQLPSRFRMVFTSGGSESNNLFIKGTCFPDKKVAHLGLEHPSVMETLESFSEHGNPPICLLEYQKEGRLDLESLPSLNDNKVRLLCLSHINNELGSIHPVGDIVSGLREGSPQTRLFLDGVQAAGKFTYNESFWNGIAGYSLSGHKFHGPKGIGLLVYDSNLTLAPQIHGGKQQSGVRSGTLPVPLIVGFAHALKLAVVRTSDTHSSLITLRDRLVTGLFDLHKQLPDLDLKFNSAVQTDSDLQSPAIVNFSFFPVEGEVVLHHLEKKNVFVGLGSACSAHSKKPSRILTGIGMSKEEAQCSLRISFSRENTLEDVDLFLLEFKDAYQSLFPTFRQKLARS